MSNHGTVGKWSPNRLARGLGWFSIGLGLAEVIAPRQLGRLIGIRKEHRFLMRVLGLREITSGIGLLTQRRPAGWVWSRVGGDAMDLALLGASMSASSPPMGRLAVTTAAVAGVTAVDLLCGQELSRAPKAGGSGAVHYETSITINRSVDELYAYWRNFENLPKFMSHLIAVQVTDPTHSHWVAKGPAGTQIEWDAEIISDMPGQVIAWKSLEGADVDNAGSVRFERATGGRGTVVRVNMQYRTMAGTVGAMFAKVLGQAPEKQIKVDLLRFKQVVETGEVAKTEGQSAGRPSSTSRKYDDLLRH